MSDNENLIVLANLNKVKHSPSLCCEIIKPCLEKCVNLIYIYFAVKASKFRLSE